MEIKLHHSTSDNSLINDIELLDENQIGNKTIITSTPILMYDALGTVVTICDPLNQKKNWQCIL